MKMKFGFVVSLVVLAFAFVVVSNNTSGTKTAELQPPGPMSATYITTV